MIHVDENGVVDSEVEVAEQAELIVCPIHNPVIADALSCEPQGCGAARSGATVATATGVTEGIVCFNVPFASADC